MRSGSGIPLKCEIVYKKNTPQSMNHASLTLIISTFHEAHVHYLDTGS